MQKIAGKLLPGNKKKIGKLRTEVPLTKSHHGAFKMWSILGAPPIFHVPFGGGCGPSRRKFNYFQKGYIIWDLQLDSEH